MLVTQFWKEKKNIISNHPSALQSYPKCLDQFMSFSFLPVILNSSHLIFFGSVAASILPHLFTNLTFSKYMMRGGFRTVTTHLTVWIG